MKLKKKLIVNQNAMIKKLKAKSKMKKMKKNKKWKRIIFKKIFFIVDQNITISHC